MAEETVFDSLNLISSEGVPKALKAANQFEEGLTSIASRLESFKLDTDIHINGYRRDIDEQLRTAELRIDDTSNKLQILFKKLSRELDQKEGEVADSIASRAALAANFIDDSQAVDESTDSINSHLESFEAEITSITGELSTGVQSFQSTANEMNSEVSAGFETYKDMHTEAASLIAETVSEGTTTIIDLMSSLKDEAEGKLEEYSGLHEGMLSILTSETDSQAGAFGETLEFAEQTIGGLNDIFEGSIGEIADKLEVIDGLIDTIKPILDFIDELT